MPGLSDMNPYRRADAFCGAARRIFTSVEPMLGRAGGHRPLQPRPLRQRGCRVIPELRLARKLRVAFPEGSHRTSDSRFLFGGFGSTPGDNVKGRLSSSPRLQA
jgi:hypothetical protein